jgi:hypothetical protein
MFINPTVSALLEYARSFDENGYFVFTGRLRKQCGGLEGGTEFKLPDSFLPIQLTPEMDTAWENHVSRKTS